MRKITEESVTSFLEGRKFNKANMSVAILSEYKVLRLHDNDIVKIYNNGDVYITDAYWATVTTKERLNGFLSLCSVNCKLYIHQKNGEWFLNNGDYKMELVSGKWYKIGNIINAEFQLPNHVELLEEINNF